MSVPEAAITPTGLKSRLAAGESVFGCMTKHPSASVVEMLGLYGWDFVVIDAEHGPIDPLGCESMTRAAEVAGATPLVRVPSNDRAAILRYLDVGPKGLHIPMVESGDDARDAVRFSKYVPEGDRGLGAVRAAGYGARHGLDEYVRRANDEMLIVVQIESRKAVERIDEILAVQEIDVVFIGPTDLAHSLGVVGQRDHPLLNDAFERICGAVTSFGGRTRDPRRHRARGA